MLSDAAGLGAALPGTSLGPPAGTSAAILDRLGADFTYKTFMYGVGRQIGDTWNGDVIIRGSGDPSISGTFYDKDRYFAPDIEAAKAVIREGAYNPLMPSELLPSLG